MINLFQELVDKIAEYVSTCDGDHDPHCSGTWWWNTNRRNLKACALVSPAFLAASQRSLFRSFTIRPRSAALAGFAQKPHLAGYVRDLRINAPNGICSILIRVLPLFGGVTRLVVDPLGASSLRAPSQSVFALLLEFPSLRFLALVNCIEVPASFIHGALSSFKEVALINTTVIEDNSPVNYFDAPTLDRLIVDCSPQDDTVMRVLERWKSSLPTPGALELSVQKNQRFLGGHELAQIYSTSLTALVIHFPEDNHNFGTIVVPHLPGIRFLTLRASDHSLSYPCTLCTTIAVLSRRMANLERLTLVLAAPCLSSFYSSLRDHRIDEALKELPHLQQVHIRGCVVNGGEVVPMTRYSPRTLESPFPWPTRRGY
ncbi:hypothetical protein C8F04DRAFT_1274068 [Mycena alexandri]|uniref:Uncharacterized protein n=1 Tax=Mycena alexandri TaxID=1745969 RepID=A0AAD6S8M0_9AGAR|nr:hypothetical protein C8F04DRAFT_1274068 [Mycena alexandri]